MALAAAVGRTVSALLVHGAGGGAWEWDLWCPVLRAHGVTARAIDLQPGPGGLAATALSDYVAQVSEAFSGLPHPRVLIGASLGGLLSAMCAASADALVLVNPLPPSPWHGARERRRSDGVIGWRRHARLSSTRDAMIDADDASALHAFRHWRDESGRAVGEAKAGIPVARPGCPTLFVVSAHDKDVPPPAVGAWAQEWRADRLETLARSHVGPLLGRAACHIAAQTVVWLNQDGRAR